MHVPAEAEARVVRISSRLTTTPGHRQDHRRLPALRHRPAMRRRLAFWGQARLPQPDNARARELRAVCALEEHPSHALGRWRLYSQERCTDVDV